MKIAFYLQNSTIGKVDCTHPLSGNPGIGGTEYMFIAIPYSLWNGTSLRHEVYLLANDISNLPKHRNCIQVSNDSELSAVVEANSIDEVVLRYSDTNLALANNLPENVGVIMWAHNFIKRSELSVLAKNDRIKCIVCVGNEQLQYYRDHQAFYKSIVIFNAYPVKYFTERYSQEVPPLSQRSNEVTFLGNLVEYKGFHLLAKAWKQVLKAVPDAHLNVIGGGKLYDRNQKLGKWGYAEELYENRFIPFLLDDNGNLLPSVTFHGVMGNEKSEILKQTKVGVPNPSGVSETFCIAAIEMQLYGSVIATINFGGFKDTVYSTGKLYKDPDELASCIIAQLNSADNDYQGFLKFAEKFDFKMIADSWIKLFDRMEDYGDLSDFLKPLATSSHICKEWNRRFKKLLPFGKYLPSAMFYNSILWRIKAIFK